MKKREKLLLLVDFQERLMPVMAEKEALEDKVVRLAKGIRTLGMPIIVTEQYKKGLGETIPSVKESLQEAVCEGFAEVEPVFIDKTSFSTMGAEEFVRELDKVDTKEVILCGIEAHICVQQTGLDLIEKGYTVYIVEDCISSRSLNDKKIATARLEKAGAIITTCEAILFEVVGGAKEPGFKEISKIIK